MSLTTKQIGERILEDFASGDFTEISGDRVEFRIDGLTLRCNRSINDVFDVSEKYRKGLKRSWLAPAVGAQPSAARTCSVTAFMDFWNDGERDNALAYLRNFPREKWPVKVRQILAS